MRISDWSSDVCSSDLGVALAVLAVHGGRRLCAFLAVGLRAAAVVVRLVLLLLVLVVVLFQLVLEADVDVEVLQHVAHFFGKQSLIAGAAAEFLDVLHDVGAEHRAPEVDHGAGGRRQRRARHRSEEHTSELQSLMRTSYAVFCLKKKKESQQQNENLIIHKTQTDPRLKTEILYNIMNHITDNQMKNMYYIKLECANTQYI